MNNIKILITGGSGFVGKPILDLLKSKNIEVCAIGRNKPDGFEGSFFEIDIYQSSKIEIFKILNEAKPTHLIHLAWYTEHDKFWNAEENITWINKTTSLIRNFCEIGGKSVIAAGSCAEYSWDTLKKLSENSSCEPETIYGISKNVTRQLTSIICGQAGVNLAWCRIFFPYGPGDKEGKLIPLLKNITNNSKEICEIKNPGSRDFLHINDIAEAIFTVLDKNVDGVINICSGISYDLDDLLVRALKHRGLSFNDRKLANTDNKQKIVSIVGSNHMLLKLGWKPKEDLYKYILE
jgi:nucleoside-diphosphate-sugar epimerase